MILSDLASPADAGFAKAGNRVTTLRDHARIETQRHRDSIASHHRQPLHAPHPRPRRRAGRAAAVAFGTCGRVGVAIGYKDAEGWTTEGWWNVSARSCETLLRGALVARYYYIYAVDYDRGGEWSGHAFMCSREKEFTIRGTENCLARGYDRTGFFEVDTSEQRSWTVQLTDSAEQKPARPLPPRTPPTTQRPPSAVPSAPAEGGKR